MKGFPPYWALALLVLVWPLEAARADPLMSYVVEGDGGAAWHLWDGATGEDRVFLELPEAPGHSFWDPKERTVTYVVGGSIYQARYDENPGRPERLGPAPDGPGEVEILWREARDSSLRAISVYVVPQADVIKAEGKPFEKFPPITYRLPDGSTIPGLHDEKWEYYIVCTEERMIEAGRWMVIEQRPDGGGYEGETCVWLDVTRRRERDGASRFALYETYRCARTLGYNKTEYNSQLCLEPLPEARRRDFDAKRSPHVHYDFVNLLPTDGAFDLAYGAAEGHATHVYGQVFLVRRDDGRIEALEFELERDTYLHQMQIGLAPGFALVAEEYSGATPHVIDLNAGKVVFRAEGRNALWVPQGK